MGVLKRNSEQCIYNHCSQLAAQMERSSEKESSRNSECSIVNGCLVFANETPAPVSETMRQHQQLLRYELLLKGVGIILLHVTSEYTL